MAVTITQTETQSQTPRHVSADTSVSHVDAKRKTYGMRWSTALSLANSGAACTTVSQLYDGLKIFSETGRPDIIPGLRELAAKAFDTVTNGNTYAYRLLTEEFQTCISLMDKVRPGGYSRDSSLGTIFQERITEAAMLIAQLIAMLRLDVSVSPDNYGDACAVSILGVLMHDSLGPSRTRWVQDNKTLEYYSGVDSRAGALFSLACSYLLADGIRDPMGGTGLDLVRAHLTSNVCEAGYGIGAGLITLIGGESAPESPVDLAEDFRRLERAILEAVALRGATLSPKVMQAISNTPKTCDSLMQTDGTSFKAAAATFGRLCMPSLYASMLRAGHPDSDLTAFTLYYTTGVIPTWVPEERLSAVITIKRVLYGLEGLEPEGVTTEQDTRLPFAEAYEAIQSLKPTQPGELDLRELCQVEFKRCWELRRDRNAAWRYTWPTSPCKMDTAGVDDDVYFRMRRCEGMWDFLDCLSAAVQGVTSFGNISDSAVRAAVHRLESLTARRRAKQDFGRLLDVDIRGKAEPAAEAALGLYALPEHDYGIGVTEVRSPRLTIMASVFTQLLPMPGNVLWQLLSRKRNRQVA